MPQMSPLGWAWVSIFVVMVYLLYLVGFYFFYSFYFNFGKGGELVKDVWFWEW